MSTAPLVVLAPHLDDAALSLGGALSGTVADAPLVVTIYTDGPPADEQPARLRPFGDYPRRLAEDARAAELLGWRTAYLGLREHLWRGGEPRLRSVFRPGGAGDAYALLAEVRGCVATILDDHPEAVVLAPLGIGGHVDHVELAAAALQATIEREQLGRVAFYEDFYAVSEHLRRRHPVAVGWPMRAAQQPLRVGVRTRVVGGLLARIPRGRTFIDLVPAAARLAWRPEVLPVDAAGRAAKLRAVDAYASQVATLGALASQLPAVLERQLDATGGERIWWPERVATA